MKKDLLKIDIDLDDIISKAPGHVYWKDKAGVYRGCNDLQAKSAGLESRDEIVGMIDFDMPWSEQAESLQRVDIKVMDSREVVVAEEVSELADGVKSYFLSRKEPLIDKKGDVVGIIGVSIDVTPQKVSETLAREKVKIEGQVETMKVLASSIAHELRTPLFSILMGVRNANRFLATLLAVYHKAKEAELLSSSEKLDSNMLDLFSGSLERSEREAQLALSLINMLLMNVKQAKMSTEDFKEYSMKACIELALSRYVFQGDDEGLVQLIVEEDFTFKGSEEFMMHVFFNLIKNALFYIKKAQKGFITITVRKDEVIFRDTGPGIPKEHLPKIFDRFYSKREGGTGLGLAFIKLVMESVGGSVRCDSVEEDFTEFTLSFPDGKTS